MSHATSLINPSTSSVINLTNRLYNRCECKIISTPPHLNLPQPYLSPTSALPQPYLSPTTALPQPYLSPTPLHLNLPQPYLSPTLPYLNPTLTYLNPTLPYLSLYIFKYYPHLHHLHYVRNTDVMLKIEADYSFIRDIKQDRPSESRFRYTLIKKFQMAIKR